MAPGAPRWEAAAKDAEQLTLRPDAAPSDCKSVEVTVLGDGTAHLEFTTTEGRHADRQLQNPDELAPALEALLVTVMPRPQPAASVSDTTPLAPRESHSNQATQAEPLPARARPHFIIGVAAGARFTFGHKYLAPVASLRASGVFDRWELGIFGEWDPLFKRLSGATPAGFAMSALVVGALFGRREHAGRFDVTYGVDLGIASVASSADSAGASNVDASQQRAGLYLGGCYPSDKATRVTLGVLTDAALSGVRGPATAAAGLPPIPRYGVALTLGVETVAL
ncbi:MAG: hypothetical protein ABI548_22700 [Polyangiaceae bacterium]